MLFCKKSSIKRNGNVKMKYCNILLWNGSLLKLDYFYAKSLFGTGRFSDLFKAARKSTEGSPVTKQDLFFPTRRTGSLAIGQDVTGVTRWLRTLFQRKNDPPNLWSRELNSTFPSANCLNSFMWKLQFASCC